MRLRLDPERRRTLEAVLFLAVASLLLRLVPFARLARFLGQPRREGPPRELADTAREAMRVRRAVRRAARRLPWGPMCLPQALASVFMLRRRGIRGTFYLGIDPARGYDAHAWVRVGHVVVNGPWTTDRFTVVGSFS
jgi:hypothetical protein